VRFSDRRRNSIWRKVSARRRGVITTPAKLVSCDSSCEAALIARCGLSGCSWSSSWCSSPDSICLTTSSVSTKKR
jgi:hypothetical protein